MTMGTLDTAPPTFARCSAVRSRMASATAEGGAITGPYSSPSSSFSRQRGSSAVESCTIWTMRGRRVPISTSRTLKRNCQGW